MSVWGLNDGGMAKSDDGWEPNDESGSQIMRILGPDDEGMGIKWQGL